MEIEELIIRELIKTGAKTQDDLALIKRRVAKKHDAFLPKNINLLKTYHRLIRNKSIKKSKTLETVLRVRPVRSLSGIVNVSVLTKPYPCPGKCIYCPSQENVPKSYLNNEPAVMRAILNKYDPFQQVITRIKALDDNGHPTDKVELRIIGGTWSFYPRAYQTYFIKRCLDACNNNNKKNKKRKAKGENLEQTQKRNEKAQHRIVGLSVETRPDFITEKEVKRMRKLGITKVELGVQSTYDDVLKLNKRGHLIKSTIEATRLLKDAGLKIGYQMMLNLPGSNLKKDAEMFEELFSNPDFQPDLLKIYPTALLRETPLYKWWKADKYRPYSEKQLIDLVKAIKKKIPFYVRIERIVRDIPSSSIVAGPAKLSNLRQVIAEHAKQEHWHCKCIRCREIREEYDPKEKLKLFRQDYGASKGKEIFLSFEDEKRKRIHSLLRLRIPSQEYFIPTLNKAVIIREIHTYGQQLSLNQEALSNKSAQHKGLGKKLMKEAEKIAKKEFGFKKIAVISAIGVRPYFRKLGYFFKETYLLKNL